MSLFIPLLAGVAAKLYDDLEDNNFLQKFRNNTLMEFLKGIHYISFTSLSICSSLVLNDCIDIDSFTPLINTCNLFFDSFVFMVSLIILSNSDATSNTSYWNTFF